jgi:hypothetical protein
MGTAGYEKEGEKGDRNPVDSPALDNMSFTERVQVAQGVLFRQCIVTWSLIITKSITEVAVTFIVQGKYGAGGENRTPTPLREPDFESGASASSTTPARCAGIDSKGSPLIRSNTLNQISFSREA